MTEEQVFQAALELADEAARAAYLDKACGVDTTFRRQVEALLAAHFKSGEFLDVPAAEQCQAGSRDDNTIAHEGAAVSAEKDHEDESDGLPFLAPSTRPDSLGRLGHYEVLQVLGKGGFGIVFRAFDDVLQRVVAVKVMAPQMAATSPARRRFLREARSSAAVRHENVVQVYEVGEQPLPYLAMEFIPGETLQQKLDRTGPLEVPEVLRVGRQIAEGLAAAHACDLIHRDIKPGNILLEGGSHKAKITDFGLARAADDASISQSGVIAGTPMYMAPEQALGQTLDQRADLFSLGSILYQMVAGRPPFRANTMVAVLKRVADEKPRAIREIIPETPQWLCDIIAKLHAKDPDDRFQSAREVADVLADCEAQLKANAKLKDYSRIPRSRPQRPGRWMWLVAAAIVLLPVLALAVTEFAGVTHLFRLGPPKKDPDQPGPAANTAFDAKEAQEASAKQLGIPVETTNSIGMKLRFIPAGRFKMGSSQEEMDRWRGMNFGKKDWINDRLPAEGPEHEVEITRSFYMGTTEVTVGQFRQFVEEEGYQVGDVRWKDVGFEQTEDHPVIWITWQNAVDFCHWLGKKDGKAYRLPTEAEWEYSCRAGKSGVRYCFGDDDGELENYAWYDKESAQATYRVGKKKPNDWGIYDMHGNVWEWCQDYYDPNYYKNSPVKDPQNGAGAERVFRGGAWSDPNVLCRSAFRLGREPDFRFSNLGFRVVLAVSPPAGVGTKSGAKDDPSSTVIAPFADADVRRIAALSAEKRVEEVRKELMQRNPGFDGKMEHKIEDGVVTDFKIVTDQVTDIAPIRVFNGLRVLECAGTHINKPKGLLADLTPLEGMNLAGLTHLDLTDTKATDEGMVYFKDCKTLMYLDLTNTQVTDTGLAQFKDCKNLTYLQLVGTQLSDAGLVHFQDWKALTHLNLAGTNVSDVGLAHFKDCKNLTFLHLDRMQVGDAGVAHFKNCENLTSLNLGATRVSDAGLANFKGMRLTNLYIDNTSVTDLNPLQDMPLEDIRLTPKNITRGLDILRDMKSLKTIGIDYNQAWPAAEFWQRYDKGEFKQ